MTTLEIIQKTKAAWGSIRDLDAAQKNRILSAMADSLEAAAADILRCQGPYFRRDAGPAPAGRGPHRGHG